MLSTISILCLILVPTLSHAYIDPGAGSALIQGLIGIIVAAAVALKLYWHRLLRFFGMKKPTSEEATKKDS